MSERLKSMQHIVAVQAQRKRLAEWALAAIDSRQAALATARTDLGGYIDTAELTGPLAGLALKQTRRLAEREAETVIERAQQLVAVQAAERRHRLAERVMEAAAVEARMLDERRSLEVLIEDAVGREQTDRPR